MDNFIEEIANFLIEKRTKEIKELKPDSSFTISIDEDKILKKALKEKREDFRRTVRDALVKAYIKSNFEEDNIDEIEEAIEKYRKVNLIISIPESVKMGDVNAEDHERKIITFSCEIQTISEPKTLPLKELFTCDKCGDSITQDFGVMEFKCPLCKIKMKDAGVAESETVVTVLLRELNRTNKRNPVKFMADIHREQARQVDYNQRVMVTGIFKSLAPNTDRNRSKVKSEILIDVITLESTEVDKSQKYSEKELEKFRELAKNGKLLDMLVDSYAPHIYGEEDAKLASILSLVGGVKQRDHRPNIHIFFAGDPGTAKTEIGEWMHRVTPNSTITDGTGSTGVGLGVGAVKLPDGTQGISLGPLVKYDFVFVDELDKMKKSDYDMLLRIMQNGECNRNIAGADVMYYTNVTLIASANPVGGKWDLKNPSIADNINLKPYLLSRFSLMRRFLNIPNKERDRAIVEHRRNWRLGKIKVPFSEEELMSFLNSVRHEEPVMSEETEKFLGDFYVKREDYQKDENSLSMDQRNYSALIVIAYAVAKILLKKEVDEECVTITLDLYKRCIESFGLSFEEGGSFSEASKGLIKYTENREQAFRRIFRDLEKKAGEVFREDLV